MSLISVARTAARWLGFDLGRDDGHVAQAVVVIDPATGEAGAHGLTDAQLRASAVPVSLAATPGLTDAQLRATAIPTINAVIDSTGQPFSPGSCAHTCDYSAGLLVTDTATDGTSTWVKTYSYTLGKLTGETKWVRK